MDEIDEAYLRIMRKLDEAEGLTGRPKSRIIGEHDGRIVYHDEACPHCGVMPYWRESGPGHVQVCAGCKQ